MIRLPRFRLVAIVLNLLLVWILPAAVWSQATPPRAQPAKKQTAKKAPPVDVDSPEGDVAQGDAPADLDPAEADLATDADTAPPGTSSASGVASAYWVVDFDCQALRMIAPREGAGGGKVYWYMLYTLQNSAKVDRDLFIKITAQSENAKLYSDLYLPSVEKAIERHEGRPYWGKADEFDAISASKRKPSDPKYSYFTLKAGEKRDCVAVFNRLDPNANKITIQIAGLSNEVRPVTKEDGSRTLEQRVRELQYERPGDEFAMTMDSFKLVARNWIKRQLSARPEEKAP